jgi:hypothetical protein
VHKPPLGPLKILPPSLTVSAIPAAPNSTPVSTTGSTGMVAASRVEASGSGARVETLEAQVGRQDWPELMEVWNKNLAPVAAKIAELPGYIAYLHKPNLDAGIAAVCHGLTEEDAKILFWKDNLEAFIKRFDEFKKAWLRRLRNIEQPRRQDVEEAYLRTVDSICIFRGLSEDDAMKVAQHGNLEALVKQFDEFRKDWLQRLGKIDQPRQNDVQETFLITIDGIWNRYRGKRWIVGVIVTAILSAAIGFAAAVIFRG